MIVDPKFERLKVVGFGKYGLGKNTSLKSMDPHVTYFLFTILKSLLNRIMLYLFSNLIHFKMAMFVGDIIDNFRGFLYLHIIYQKLLKLY